MKIDFHSFVANFVQTVEAKDSYTAGHSDRVAELALLIAESIGLDEETCYKIHIAGHLHDIGKIGIPDGILLKSGKLTKEEFEVMKTHSRIGYNIFQDNKLLTELAEIILYHHERYDGTGYPCGIKGEEIPIGARIIAVADSFDAMVTRRTYKEKISLQDALEDIKNQSGRQFDPVIAQTFISLFQNKTVQGKVEEIITDMIV